MKKTLITIAFSLIFLPCLAQLKVYQNGCVGLSNNLSSSNIKLNVGNKSYANSYSVFLSSTNPSSGSYNIGMEGWAIPASPQTTGRTFGVRGIAGNCTNGYNYGVTGCLTGVRNGAGVYGTTGNVLGDKVDGKYAGYFKGDMKATGVTKAFLTNQYDAYTANSSSAITSALSIITSLNALRGTFYEQNNNDSLFLLNDGSSTPRDLYSNHYKISTSSIPSQSGLAIQDENGQTYLNYTELIPVLVAAIQELSSIVSNLQMANTALFDTSEVSAAAEDQPSDGGNLSQNTPNPFECKTVIRYHIPENAVDARILIFNMQGMQVGQHTVTPKSDRMVLDGSDYPAGMYFYSLIVDRKEAGTRRMIISR